MSLIELQRELKILKKKILKEKLKLERRHRKEINHIITPLEEKIYVTKLRIKAFQNNSNSSSNLGCNPGIRTGVT